MDSGQGGKKRRDKMGIENPNNNPMLKIFGSSDFYTLENEWKNFAEQSTIKIVDQSMVFDGQQLIMALWYIWKR